jgi:hypothetical protein
MSAIQLRVKRAGTSGVFVGYLVNAGTDVSAFTALYAEKKKLDDDTVLFYEVPAGQFASFDGRPVPSSPAGLGPPLASNFTFTSSIDLIAKGDPLGKSPVRESSLASFRSLSLFSTATHFILE